MKKRSIPICLVIVISALIVVLPAYSRHSHLKRAKLLPTDLSFENVDKESLLDSRQNQPKVFVSNAFLIMLYLGTNALEHISYFSYLTFFLDHTAMILRC